METCKIKNLYNLNETAAKELFEGAEYPWEVLPKIGDFIRKLGETLREEEYEKRGEDVWVAKSAKVAPISTALQLLEKRRRYATVRLSVEMHWWEKEPLWEIPQS